MDEDDQARADAVEVERAFRPSIEMQNVAENALAATELVRTMRSVTQFSESMRSLTQFSKTMRNAGLIVDPNTSVLRDLRETALAVDRLKASVMPSVGLAALMKSYSAPALPTYRTTSIAGARLPAWLETQSSVADLLGPSASIAHYWSELRLQPALVSPALVSEALRVQKVSLGIKEQYEVYRLANAELSVVDRLTAAPKPAQAAVIEEASAIPDAQEMLVAVVAQFEARLDQTDDKIDALSGQMKPRLSEATAKWLTRTIVMLLLTSDADFDTAWHRMEFVWSLLRHLPY